MTIFLFIEDWGSIVNNEDLARTVAGIFEMLACDAPYKFPKDEVVKQATAQRDWLALVKRLKVMRESLSEQEIRTLRSEGRGHESMAYMAQELLAEVYTGVIRVFSQTLERRIIDSLHIAELA